jgi:nicotinate-nucleotide--dimethylbenzimidazole phosphoribosyltransferase
MVDPSGGVADAAALIDSTVARITPVDGTWIERARDRQRHLTKPEGSLGRLEEVANRFCGIQETLEPTAANPRIILFAADHGVAAEGVSAYPQSVTSRMVLNFLDGGAAINALAGANRVELRVVDVGVRAMLPESPDLVRRRIGNGTENLAREPAMSRAQAAAAIGVGIGAAAEAADEGCRVIGIGEMGIANTTSAAGVAAVLTHRPARALVGRGTGIDDPTLERKVAVVRRAVGRHRPSPDDAIGILSALGGFEIAAMCGACLGAAAERMPVLVDGFISTSAAALAAVLCPAVREYMFGAHRSPEPGHGALLGIIDQPPLLDLGMRLGEGTGAALAVAIVRSAVTAFREMATFDNARVPERLGPGGHRSANDHRPTRDRTTHGP